jgi:hypothetical protein
MERDSEQKAKVHGDFVGGDFVTGEDISSSSAIVLGLEEKGAVVKYDVPPPLGEDVGELRLSFDDLDGRIDQSGLPPTAKDYVHANLRSLRSEVERGEAGDVQVVRHALAGIGETMPELREPLWDWLDSTEQVSTPIRIVARKLLT